MTLKSRIGDLLQGRQPGSGDSAPDSEAGARVKQQQQDEANRLHMKRLRLVRNRELDELRMIMFQRKQYRADNGAARAVKSTSPSGVTRPPSGVEGSQMVSLINELEVKVLSEPMGLKGPPLPRQPTHSPTTAKESAWPSNSSSSQVNPLDDPALMVAARRWDRAGELLLRAVCAGEVTGGSDWATRSAIDLFERGGQTMRAGALKQQYLKTRGRAPGRIVPPKLSAPVAGRLHVFGTHPWRCPSRLGLEEALTWQTMLHGSKAGSPLVVDWTEVTHIDAMAIGHMQRAIEGAMKSQAVFVHIGLSRLIRTVRQELQTQMFSQESWAFWLTLLNWNGFRNAHRTAATAFAKRFQCDPPPYLSVKCICHTLNKPTATAAEDLVCSVRFLGDLTREHAEELERLEIRSALPGRLVLLDCRLLTSVDFFFGTDLLNWVIRRHARGESVSITYAHPLLAHFLQMLGLQGYAKLHCLPSPQRP